MPDRLGEFETITGVRCKKLICASADDYDQEVLACGTKFESDFEPVERILQDIYSLKPAPELNSSFIDIEVDYNPEIGFAGPKNPYAPINALTLLSAKTKKFTTFALPPPSWTGTLPEDLADVILCKSEEELLTLFLDCLHEVDVLSGWNSEFYDMPYIGKRIEMVLGQQALQLLGLEGSPMPRWSEKARFKGAKEKEPILLLNSRVHLDMLLLFKKFNLTTRPSFKLDSVAMDELGEQKLHYDGSLADLYKNDFVRFLRYNRHDTTLLDRLDGKFRYIELANRMVHEAAVNFTSIFGSVALIDSAIICYAHNQLKKIVFDRAVRPESPPVEGAIVMTPKPGFYRWIGACDINSLYPSTIRSLNLSPERIIGQLDKHEESWRAFRDARLRPDDAVAQNVPLTLYIDGSNEPLELNAGELVALCVEHKYAVSGYGTILDQTEIGLLPSILAYWFNGRKEMQALKKKHAKEADRLIAEGRSKDDPAVIHELARAAYYDVLQGVRKVLLNSTYGALLNEYMRFGDPRLGASTTFTGRQITTNMVEVSARSLSLKGRAPKLNKKVNVIDKTKRTGETVRKIENEYTIDLQGDAGPIYGDTDSVYFHMEGVATNEDEAIAVADGVADAINESFPSFMQQVFNCQPGYENLIKANRELVCRSGILQAKKKYMMAVIDKEGKRITKGSDEELKTMGSDIRVSSTPQLIKDMLAEVVMGILYEEQRSKIDQVVIDFRNKLKNTGADSAINPLDMTSIVSVNEVDDAFLKLTRIELAGQGKVKIPPNSRSAAYYNWMIEKVGDKEAQPIKAGQKIKPVWLARNDYGIETIAFPSEAEELPEWFHKYFEVDKKLMEAKLVDQKLKLVYDAMGWEVPTERSVKLSNLLEFD